MLDGETVRTNLVADARVRERLVARRRGAVLPRRRRRARRRHRRLAFGVRHARRRPQRAPRGRAPVSRSASRVAPSFVLTEPQSGIGDTQLKFARLIGRDQGFVVQASVKLPTGEEDMLAGSGSGDWSLTLLRTRPLLGAASAPAGYFWGVGLVRAGDPHRIDFDAETWVPTGVVGGSWQVLPKFGLKGQLDVHGAFFDSPLEEIGETAIQATLSAWRRMGQRGHDRVRRRRGLERQHGARRRVAGRRRVAVVECARAALRWLARALAVLLAACDSGEPRTARRRRCAPARAGRSRGAAFDAGPDQDRRRVFGRARARGGRCRARRAARASRAPLATSFAPARER